MPDADLTLTAVWGDRFDWELIDEASDAIRLTRYNGTSRTIEITDPYKGLASVKSPPTASAIPPISP